MSLRIKASLDVTKDVCPMTFVKTKLKLESLRTGDILEVILKEGAALQDVPKSVRAEGHKIIDLRREGSVFHLYIEKT